MQVLQNGDTKASPSVLCTIPKSLRSSEKLKAENVNVNVNVNETPLCGYEPMEQRGQSEACFDYAEPTPNRMSSNLFE